MTLGSPPVAFYGALPVPTAAPLPPPGAIRRGDRVVLTIAACVRWEVPRESAGGVLKEFWLDAGATQLLVEVRLSDRTVEAVVGPADVTKEG